MVYYGTDGEDQPAAARRRVDPRKRAEAIAKRKERNSALSGEEAITATREAALRLLDRCDYASAKLSAKLREKGFPEAAIAAVLARLTELGYVDDRRYAENLINNQFAMRGIVGRALRLELTRRGVPPQIADEVIAQSAWEGEDLIARAVALGRRKYESSPPDKAYQRTTALLARRGYSPGVISSAIAQIRAELDQESAASHTCVVSSALTRSLKRSKKAPMR